MKNTLSVLFVILIWHSASSQDVIITLNDCEISDFDSEQVKKVYTFQRDFYKSIFSLADVNTYVELFGDFEEYKHYQRLVSKTSKSNSGFVSSNLNAAVIYKKKDYVNVINHELSHLILNQPFPDCPKWLDEGLAEYFEYFQFKDEERQLRLQYHKIGRVVNWIEEDKIKLSKFIKQSDDTWNSKNRKPNFYSSSVSYCLVLFMMEKGVLKELLQASVTEKSFEKQIKKKYPGGFESFKTDFQAYILKMHKMGRKVLTFQ